MPELPEVAALAAYLRERAVGLTVTGVDVVALSALKTYDPPVSALVGRRLTTAGYIGKYLDIEFGELHLVTHLSRAGWLHYREKITPGPLRPGKGPISVRVRFDDGSGFDLTEAGTQKRLAVHIVTDPRLIERVATLGPSALTVTLEEFTVQISKNAQIKGVLTDQRTLAGIGNAYSDEILHAAKLSPFAMGSKLTAGQVSALYDAVHEILDQAIAHTEGQRAATLKSEKRAGLRVHGRTGLPCPVCGDTIREVSFATSNLQYCPTCQTKGKPLADRRLSKLVR
ncbi:putative formamidopyrimidine-DNA glycosylase [Longispora fulva]|uniref:Formamidopyrimidine-DNA glycosylase n=1 Tax=Longispora fulva TaxID=619741 RepID=A0A8J7KYW5_9ACTN|nr:Fpg/Nei family DNA glycosylase [Longispora fulva]MBG6139742.1 formamidopyrimidine-DNA glycosylase [Longispora fulva]GIG57874.1 putative formamidopyrimidine-DNA glycosylase [Longispora fulva]